ncbi:hypothetical protein [Rhodopirellula sp. SWK7]|uniref:hypothetical protein n=1 Tax=Rhodopirellula sp. SWK7 TaxID=595460 RepID=UPI0002BE0C6F|nr:hypothetical protein [Rhodopirellula sp. SWK7]EMI44532.1 nacht domain family [Rhodopirellula sp. SWK7]
MTGGGKATTAGIDFQHRMGAFSMVAVNLRLDLAQFICELASPSIPVQLSFETRDAIDDINMLCDAGHRIFFQVKKSISLSEITDSIFDKVIDQFLRQHRDAESKSADAYILLTSPSASGRITRDLKRVLNAVREDSENYNQVSFNKHEKETLDKYRAVFERAFQSASGNRPSENDFVEFSEKVYVETFDLEAGGSFEKASKLLLTSSSIETPELVWSSLLKSSLSYGGSRAVVSRETIDGLLDRYRTSPTTDTQSQNSEHKLNVIAEQAHGWPAGMEFVLVEGFPEDGIVALAAMSRFSDDGSKRFEFFDDQILVTAWEKPYKIHHRTATLFGMERFLSENAELFDGKHLVHLESEYEENPNDSDASVAFGDMCDKKFRRAISDLKCLHCGLTINEPKALMIEIDQRAVEHLAGLCHRKCVRPINRVVGLVEVKGAVEEAHLRTFDALAWGKRLMRGQAGVREALEITQERGMPTPMIWNPENLRQEALSYCVECELDDGSRHFMTARGKIVRSTEPESEAMAAEYNRQIRVWQEKKDPLGYNLDTLVYANYSMLLSQKRDGEEIGLCREARAVQYSAFMEKGVAKYEWYAPLCKLMHPDSDQTISLGLTIPLLSDPLRTSAFVENWKKAGIDIQEFSLGLIEDDVAFNQLMQRISENDMQVIIDPVLDMKGNLVTGIPVEPMERWKKFHPQDEGNA